jgi:tetratricopeptide (TPR) repeat protein
MRRFLLLALTVSTAFAAAPVYELSGRILPKSRATVSLFGTTSPYSESTFLFPGLSFHFKKLPAGAYSLVVFMRSRGEARRTVEVGPGTADHHRRVTLRLDLKDTDFVLASALNRHVVSTRQLSVPAPALRQFRDAQRDLSKHNVEAAVKKLEDVVERAPQFSAAWNNLGTIAYQSGNYARAEECFRESLEQDPASYEALVNLGGVLVTLHKLAEALDRNSQAVALRPNDALAQSQLGMTYYLLGQFDLATKHLEQAREIDPTHFSFPQLILAQIHFRQGDPHAAADALEDFLSHHPDWPQATAVRNMIVQARSHE